MQKEVFIKTLERVRQGEGKNAAHSEDYFNSLVIIGFIEQVDGKSYRVTPFGDIVIRSLVDKLK